MPVRRFDGVDDRITTAIGSLGFAFGPGTIAAIIRRTADSGTTETVLKVGTSGTSSQYRLEIHSGDPILRLQSGTSAAGASGLGPVTANGWALVAATKASGSAPPRLHVYTFATAIWQHADAASNLPNSGTPGTSATIGATNTPTQWFEGDLGIMGVWNTVLNDAAIEALILEEQEWVDASPVALWVFDQPSLPDALQDDIGAADETAIVGTTVVSDTIPWTGVGTPVSATFGGPIDVAAPAALSVDLRYEAVKALAASGTASIENVLAVSNAKTAPVDAPEGVAPVAVYTASYESVATVALIATGAYEVQGPEVVLTTFAGFWDAPGAVVAPHSGSWEAGWGVASTRAAVVESLAPLSTTHVIPIEAGGEAGLVVTFALAYEAVVGISARATGNVDSTGPISGVRQLPVEAGGEAGLSAAFAFTWEAIGNVTGLSTGPYESAPGHRVRYITPGRRTPDLVVTPGTRDADLALAASTRTPPLTLEVT